MHQRPAADRPIVRYSLSPPPQCHSSPSKWPQNHQGNSSQLTHWMQLTQQLSYDGPRFPYFGSNFLHFHSAPSSSVTTSSKPHSRASLTATESMLRISQNSHKSCNLCNSTNATLRNSNSSSSSLNSHNFFRNYTLDSTHLNQLKQLTQPEMLTFFHMFSWSSWNLFNSWTSCNSNNWNIPHVQFTPLQPYKGHVGGYTNPKRNSPFIRWWPPHSRIYEILIRILDCIYEYIYISE